MSHTLAESTREDAFDFRSQILHDLGGLETTLLSTGEVAGIHEVHTPFADSELFWLSYRAAIAEVRLLEALEMTRALAEYPPLISERAVKQSWPDFRGAVSWSAYIRNVGRFGYSAPIPYLARDLKPLGPELLVLVATLVRDIETIRAFVNLGLHRQGQALLETAEAASALLSRPPFVELYQVVRDQGHSLQLPVIEALERLERGRASTPSAHSLYRWIKDWYSDEEAAARLHRVALRGEALNDRLYELWCATRLMDSISSVLGSTQEPRVYPLFQRYLPGYVGHGELFELPVPTTTNSALKLRIHFQRTNGVLNNAINSAGQSVSLRWKQLRSGTMKPSVIIPDIIVSLSYVNSSGLLVHRKAPILVDAKNRSHSGSDERLKMLGYLQAASSFAQRNHVHTAILFFRDEFAAKSPALSLNIDRIIHEADTSVHRTARAIYEIPAEPGSFKATSNFELVARKILNRFRLRS